MADPRIELSSQVASEDRDVVRNGLMAYNAQQGHAWVWQDLDFILRDDVGHVIGGILAETNLRWCFIKGLWVAEALRGRGHGSRLLSAVETGARERDCIGAYLDTYEFQARPFYERHGYSVFGVLPDMPPGGAKYYLAKRLDRPDASSE